MSEALSQVSGESGANGTGRKRATNSGGNKRGHRRPFGSVRKLPSGRFQARYTGPDGRLHTAPMTFLTKTDAHGFLSTKHGEVIAGTWKPVQQKVTVPTFAEYAPAWMEARKVRGKPLAPLTRARYASLLRDHLVPAFGPMRLHEVTAHDVADWHNSTTAPDSTRAMAYRVLAAIFKSAVREGHATVSPCQIEGASQYERKREVVTATPAEITSITKAMPAHLALAVQLGTWCALRIGEVIALTRADINLTMGTVSVTKQASQIDGETRIVAPKSFASVRTVAIPPGSFPAVQSHLEDHAAPGKDGALFPGPHGGRISRTQLFDAWDAARKSAGRKDLRFHDLRHTGLTIYAQQGATIADLMHRGGHSSPEMALHYQQAVQGRDAELTERMSLVIGGDDKGEAE